MPSWSGSLSWCPPAVEQRRKNGIDNVGNDDVTTANVNSGDSDVNDDNENNVNNAYIDDSEHNGGQRSKKKTAIIAMSVATKLST